VPDLCHFAIREEMTCGSIHRGPLQCIHSKVNIHSTFRQPNKEVVVIVPFLCLLSVYDTLPGWIGVKSEFVNNQKKTSACVFFHLI
jgi:hypothetical protein